MEKKKILLKKKIHKKKKKNLVSNLSHDLKTPIGLISGYADGLRSGMARPDAEVKEYCDVICDESDRMMSMILRMMELFRLESGTVDLIFTNYPNSRLGHGCHIQFIKDFHDCFVASRKYYGELEHQTLSLKELLTYPILMLNRNSTTSEFLHSLFQQQQLDLVPEIELSSNDLLIDLATIGLGIAFVPDFCVQHNAGDLFRIPLKTELPARQLAIIHNEQMPVSNAARQFMGYFEKP